MYCTFNRRIWLSANLFWKALKRKQNHIIENLLHRCFLITESLIAIHILHVLTCMKKGLSCQFPFYKTLKYESTRAGCVERMILTTVTFNRHKINFVRYKIFAYDISKFRLLEVFVERINFVSLLRRIFCSKFERLSICRKKRLVNVYIANV